MPLSSRNAGFDPVAREREAGDLDSCFCRNDGRLHIIVICSSPLPEPEREVEEFGVKVEGPLKKMGLSP